MDNLTHTLTAVAISQTGLNRKTRFATLTLILAANAPDIDILRGLKSGIDYLKYHRGISHSFVGITVLAIILWGVIYWVGKKAPAQARPSAQRPLAAACRFFGNRQPSAARFHQRLRRPAFPALQWTMVRVGYHADHRSASARCIGLGLAVPWLLRLVSEEVGAGKRELGARRGLLPGRDGGALGNSRFRPPPRAEHPGQPHLLRRGPQRFGAFPVALNPFTWTGVVETETAFHVVSVNALDANGVPEEMETFEKPQPSPALTAAMKTRAGKIFLDFARFPWAQVDESGRRLSSEHRGSAVLSASRPSPEVSPWRWNWTRTCRPVPKPSTFRPRGGTKEARDMWPAPVLCVCGSSPNDKEKPRT